VPEPSTCTSCAAEIPAGARFCVKCGTAAPAAAPAPSYSAGTDPSFGAGAGAGDVPTQVPPGGASQTAPTQPGVPAYPQAPATGPSAVPPGGYTPPAAPGQAYGAAPPLAGGYQAPPTQWGAPVAPVPVARAPKPPKPKGSARNVLAGLLGLVSALVLGVSTFLEWAEIETFRNISGAVVTGWDGLTSGVQDGALLAAVAVVAGFLSASMISGRASLLQKLLLLLAGAVAVGMSVYELADHMVDVDDIVDHGGSASLGIGLWIALVASFGLLVAAFVAKRSKPEKAVDPGFSPVGAQYPAATVGDPRAVGAVGSAPA
jgi:hypothetical protein